jgi:hypothetical protein
MDFKSKYLKYKNKYLQLKNIQLGGEPYTIISEYDELFFWSCEDKYEEYKIRNDLYIKYYGTYEYIPVVFDGCPEDSSIPQFISNFNKKKGITNYIFKITDMKYKDTNPIKIIVHNHIPLGNIQVFIGPPNEISKKYIEEDPKRKEVALNITPEARKEVALNITPEARKGYMLYDSSNDVAKTDYKKINDYNINDYNINDYKRNDYININNIKKTIPIKK